MSFVQIPYPVAPWLKIEFSDVFVLLAFSLYSFPGAIIVAIIKTLLDFAYNGLTSPLGIGNITAFITSILYCVIFLLVSRVLKLFHKDFKYRLLGYGIITITISFLLVLLNALFITPTFLVGSYTTAFNNEVANRVTNALNGMLKTNINSYFLIIFVTYFPFNILKAVLILLIYELIYKRLFMLLIDKSPKMKKYFNFEQKDNLSNNENTKKDVNEDKSENISE